MRILLVDDESVIRKYYGWVLKDAGYEHTTAEDGEDAINKIRAEDFSVVISDVNMPKSSGLDLIKRILQERPEIKVILLTGFKQLPKAQAALVLACHAFLPKPVKKEDLLAAVSSAVGEPSAAAEPLTASRNSDFASVSIDGFINVSRAPFSVFAELPDRQFLKLSAEGEDVTDSKVAEWRARGVTQLWIPREQFRFYLELCHRQASLAVFRPDLEDRRRAKMLRHACEVAYENLHTVGINPVSFTSAKEIIAMGLRAIDQKAMATALLESLEAVSPSAYSHAVMNGMLCAMITRVMDWTSKKNIIALTMGAFFHDVGLGELGFELHSKPLDKMTPAQREIYFSHPKQGAEKLALIPSVPPEVIQIVEQHHETGDEKGFPARMPKTQIFPMSRIVNLVDQFVDELMKYSPQARKDGSKILRYVTTQDEHLDPAAVLALSMILSCPDLDSARRSYDAKVMGLARRAG